MSKRATPVPALWLTVMFRRLTFMQLRKYSVVGNKYVLSLLIDTFRDVLLWSEPQPRKIKSTIETFLIAIKQKPCPSSFPICRISLWQFMMFFPPLILIDLCGQISPKWTVSLRVRSDLMFITMCCDCDTSGWSQWLLRSSTSALTVEQHLGLNEHLVPLLPTLSTHVWKIWSS